MAKYLYIAPLISFSLACSLTPAPAQVANLDFATPKPVKSQIAIVTGNVNLRTNPEGLAQSDVISTLYDGQKVTVIQRGETWCKVLTRAGKIGWALCEYVKSQ